MSHGGTYFGDRKIKCIHALAWWVTDLTLQGKYIYLYSFKSDVLSDVIKESLLNFEDNRYGKGELINTNTFSHEKWTQWGKKICNYFSSQKNVVVCHFHTSPEKMHQVLMMERTGMCRSSINKLLLAKSL